MSHNNGREVKDEKDRLLRIIDLFVAYFFKLCFVGL